VLALGWNSAAAVPYFEAASEAEAQCAMLCAGNKLYATATEDMDALTFGTPVLLRHLTFSEARKMPVMEIHLKEVLEGLGLEMDSFIDLCILMGCDYLPKVQGVGPKTAYNLIKKYKTIEAIRNSLQDDCKKLSIPYTTEEYTTVKEFFKNPDVTEMDDQFKFGEVDEDGLVAFLSDEKSFAKDRVLKGVEKIRKTKEKATQGRLESFFGPSTLIKRKVEAPPPKNAKKGKTASSTSKAGKPRR